MFCLLRAEGGFGAAEVLGVGVCVVVSPQLGALKVPLPGGRLVTPKVTVPRGLVASAGTVTVSWTVAVQVLVPPVGTLAGLQTRMVGVGGRERTRPNSRLVPKSYAALR